MYNVNGLATTGGRLIQSALSVVMGLVVLFFFIEVKNIPELLNTKKTELNSMSANSNKNVRDILSDITG